MASRVYDVEAILAELKACAELSPPAKVETWWRVSARQDLQDKVGLSASRFHCIRTSLSS